MGDNKAKKTDASRLKPKCFIIMPFGGWFDSYYREIYIPAIEKAGFEAKRADDLYRPGNIVNDIWTYTKEADVVLADLTTKNPNVFYELGLAHAITKPAVLVTSSMDDVPFDLRSLRVIVFDKNSPNWGEILQEKISKALEETLKSPEDAIPPTFLDVSKTKKLKVGEEEKELLELKRDVDSLRRELRSLGRSYNPTASTSFNRGKSVISRSIDLDSEDWVRRIIGRSIEMNMEDQEIIDMLLGRGFAPEWTTAMLNEIRETS